MMRYYSSTAGEMTLTAGIAAGDSSVQLDTVVGLPVSYPFTLFLDYGGTTEEIVEATAGSGTTLTVSRAVDGTSAQAHSLGAKVRHGMSARDLRDPQQHIAATAAHGVVGNVVGTTDAQTLTNKTLTAPLVDGGTLTDSTVVNGSFVAENIAQIPITAQSADASGLNEVIAEFKDSAGKARTQVTKNAVYVNDAAGSALVVIDAQTGGITSPTITALQARDTAQDASIGALQTSDTSQGGRLDALEAKTDRGRSSGTTDPSGNIAFSHTLGAIPAVVVASGEPSTPPYIVTAYHVGTTSTEVAFVLYKTDGSRLANTAVTINWFATL